MRPNEGQIAREFLEYLRRRKGRRPARKALVALAAISDRLNSPGVDHSGPALYQAAFVEYTRRWIRGNNRNIANQSLLLRSSLQVLMGLANEWTGHTFNEQTWGLQILISRKRIDVALVERRPMKPSPDAELVVRNFFLHLNEREYQAAWDLLDPVYQHDRWGNRFTRFESGYTDSTKMFGVQLFLRASDTDSAVFDTFYEERQNQPVIPPLRVLETMTIGKMRTGLLDLLDDLERELLTAGGSHDDFERLSFKRLFHADAAIALPWEMGIPKDKLTTVFPGTEMKYLSRARRFDLIKKGHLWKVRKISWLAI